MSFSFRITLFIVLFIGIAVANSYNDAKEESTSLFHDHDFIWNLEPKKVKASIFYPRDERYQYGKITVTLDNEQDETYTNMYSLPDNKTFASKVVVWSPNPTKHLEFTVHMHVYWLWGDPKVCKIFVKIQANVQ